MFEKSKPNTRKKYHRRKAARKEAGKRMWENPGMWELYMTLTYKSRRWWEHYAFRH